MLGEHGFKNNGYFVDIGAADGFTASNTFALEKWYKWQGICVDPNPVFAQTLFNGRDAVCSTLCVHEKTGDILPFKFLADENTFFGWNFRAGLVQHVGPIAEEVDRFFANINVLTISLMDLLKLYNAPQQIDYLSIDAEGSEWKILKSFDFTAYDITCITVEYSDPGERLLIFKLLSDHGYKQVEQHRSNNEDWYIKK